MRRALIALYVCILALAASCTQRMVCPAYQSAFIYDKEELRKKFSYFVDDSTPKAVTVNKNKYLIGVPVSYKKKNQSLQTVAMKQILVDLPDSLDENFVPGEDGVVAGAEMDVAARSVVDSTFIVDVPRDSTQPAEDSVYVISKDKEVRVLVYDGPDSLIYDASTGKYVRETPQYRIKQVRYNVDQDNYMWYMRHHLVLPDVKLAMGQQQDAGRGSGKKAKKAKGEKVGFFKSIKNIFKRKKEVQDTTVAAPKEEFDYIDAPDDTTATTTRKPATSEMDVTTSATEIAPKKKGLLNRNKTKKKKSKDPAPAPATPPAKKEEIKEDGF